MDDTKCLLHDLRSFEEEIGLSAVGSMDCLSSEPHFVSDAG